MFLQIHSTKHQTPRQPETPDDTIGRVFQFNAWVGANVIGIGTITGWKNYTGRAMPAGVYVQVNGGRWVHEAQFVKWVA